jgi:putative DNA modification/repair radical SAM protein
VELAAKLHILADAAKYDTSCASSGSNRKRPEGGLGNAAAGGICHSFTPDGRCVSLLKVLLTNYCSYDCLYCVNRISNDTPRARFTVEEVVQLTLDFYRRNYIEGLFLSSGIVQSPDYTMEQMIRVVELLRTEHKFGGYVHVKAIPGAARELLSRAGAFADRLSVNIELPVQSDLDRFAPAKQHSVIQKSMAEIHAAEEEAEAVTFAPAGQTTQMIVGATPRNDTEILQKADALYRHYKLRRVYYSAFSPIPGAPSELSSAAPPLVREHRLYQADWLIRFYGFEAAELTSGTNLPLDIDPKLDWALRHREFFPLDVNRAPREALLRVPGFGVRNVDRILSIRRFHMLTRSDLAQLRIPVRRAAPFLNFDGRLLDSPKLAGRLRDTPQQMTLFQAAREARTGEF